MLVKKSEAEQLQSQQFQVKIKPILEEIAKSEGLTIKELANLAIAKQ